MTTNLTMPRRRALVRLLNLVIFAKHKPYAWVSLSNFIDLENYFQSFQLLDELGYVDASASSVRLTEKGLKTANRHYEQFYGMSAEQAAKRVAYPRKKKYDDRGIQA